MNDLTAQVADASRRLEGVVGDTRFQAALSLAGQFLGSAAPFRFSDPAYQLRHVDLLFKDAYSCLVCLMEARADLAQAQDIRSMLAAFSKQEPYHPKRAEALRLLESQIAEDIAIGLVKIGELEEDAGREQAILWLEKQVDDWLRRC